jgi:hypothetical protein
MIAMYAVYGKDFGSKPGLNNVNALCIGNVNIKNGKLEAQKIFHNGATLPAPYTPVFYAHYKQQSDWIKIKQCKGEVTPEYNVKTAESI